MVEVEETAEWAQVPAANLHIVKGTFPVSSDLGLWVACLREGHEVAVSSECWAQPGLQFRSIFLDCDLRAVFFSVPRVS